VREFRSAIMAASTTFRLRKHADYQRVYQLGRKQFSRQMSYFFAPRSEQESSREQKNSAEQKSSNGPRVGLTVGKVVAGRAVDRNRIKRRMREAVRRHINLLTQPVDVVLHPRRSVLELEFSKLESEIAGIFSKVEACKSKAEASNVQASGKQAK
jgi:ribonuclease P protein component